MRFDATQSSLAFLPIMGILHILGLYYFFTESFCINRFRGKKREQTNISRETQALKMANIQKPR
jgi:hypothetical protein